MDKLISPYYPPRARWYAPVFRLTDSARRRLAMDHIRLPSEITWRGLTFSFLIPGMGFYLRDPRMYGRLALAACGFLILVFIAWLGFPLANLAFGLLMSIHVGGFVYYCSPALNGWRLRNRMLFTVLVLMSAGFFFYGSLRDIIQSHFLMPLRAQGRVILVNKLAPVENVHRGDLIAYHISPFREIEGDVRIHLHSGIGFGPVLAVAGDTVEFSPKGFRVNGVLHAARPDMPSSGSFVVAPKRWFIWPSESLSGHGYQNGLTSLMLKLANVSEDQYAGEPFKRWFWRNQILQ